MAMYFTSEADAREGERKEPPEALKAQMDEMEPAQRWRAEILRPARSLAVLALIRRL
jgi:hypothetical protein